MEYSRSLLAGETLIDDLCVGIDTQVDVGLAVPA